MRLNSLAVALYMSVSGVIMIPSVPPPKELVGKSIDLKLKPGWRYDVGQGVFVGPKGEMVAPASLPQGARIVYKVPTLAQRPARSLSAAERDLSRYLQVILRSARGQEKLVSVARTWPAIEDAHAAPETSLPQIGK
jgi:hypothetical protein